MPAHARVNSRLDPALAITTEVNKYTDVAVLLHQDHGDLSGKRFVYMQAQKKQINMSALLGPGPEKLTGFLIGEYRALEGKVEANGNVTERARSMELLIAGSLVPLITASTTTTFSNSASISIVIAAPAFRRAVSPHSATVQAIIATLVNMPSLSPAFDAGSPLFYLPCRSPAASMAAPGGLEGMKRRCKEENFRFKSARKERGRKIKQENQTLKEANAKVNAAKIVENHGLSEQHKDGKYSAFRA